MRDAVIKYVTRNWFVSKETMNWNWLTGKYTRFLEHQLAESRADFLERLRDKDEQLREYRVQIGALEAKVLRLESPSYKGFNGLWSPQIVNPELKPDFGPAAELEEYGDWQSQLERAIAGLNHEAPKEEAAHEESGT